MTEKDDRKKRTEPYSGNSPLSLSYKSRVLVLKREYRNVRFVVSLLAEAYLTVNKSVKSVILTHTHVQTWVVDSTSLTNEDVASLYCLITEFLDTESFAM